MSYQPVHSTHFVTGPDHTNETTRLARGAKVTQQSATSQLVLQNPDFKGAADGLNAQTVALADLVDGYNKAHIAFQTARSALGNGILLWDNLYGVYTSVGAKYVKTEQDANAAGLVLRGTNIYPLAAPLGVDLVYRVKKDELFIRVLRPKGMRSVVTQITTDPTQPALWKELDGDGSTHVIPHPAAGTYSVRAACKTAHAVSDWSATAVIVIK